MAKDKSKKKNKGADAEELPMTGELETSGDFDTPDEGGEFFKPAGYVGKTLIVMPREVGTVDYGKGPQPCVYSDLIVVDLKNPEESVLWKKQAVSNQVLRTSIEEKLGKKLVVTLESKKGKSGNDFYVYEPAPDAIPAARKALKAVGK